MGEPAILTLTVDELTLSALADGPENAPLVILVHGFPDTPHGWDAVAQGLVDQGYRVLRPWLRGYTPDSALRSANFDAYSAGMDLLAWKQHLDAKAVHLVGHDWGAVASMVAAVQSPDDIQSLTLLSIPPFQKFWRAWRLWPKQLRLSSYMLAMQSGHAPTRITRHDWAGLKTLWARWSPNWPFSTAFEPVKKAFANMDVAWAATRYYRSLFMLHKASTRKLYQIATQPIWVPTLFLVGENDGCMQAGLFETLVEPKCFPMGVELSTLPNCGHLLHIEQPQAVLKELVAHLEDNVAL